MTAGADAKGYLLLRRIVDQAGSREFHFQLFAGGFVRRKQGDVLISRQRKHSTGKAIGNFTEVAQVAAGQLTGKNRNRNDCCFSNCRDGE